MNRRRIRNLFLLFVFTVEVAFVGILMSFKGNPHSVTSQAGYTVFTVD